MFVTCSVIATPVSRWARAAARSTLASRGCSGSDVPISPMMPARTPVLPMPSVISPMSRSAIDSTGSRSGSGGWAMDVVAAARDNVDAGRA